MLVACTITLEELQHDGDFKELPEKRHDCIYGKNNRTSMTIGISYAQTSDFIDSRKIFAGRIFIRR